MKHKLFILLFGLCTACTLFKRSSKTTDQSFNNSSNKIDLYASSATDKKTDSRQYTFHNDSVSADYTMRLWPRGTASFSPTGGFSGQFDSIQVVGRQRKLQSSAKLRVNVEELKQKATIDLQQKEQIKSRNKRVEKAKSPQKLLVIFLVVFVFLAIFITTRGCILALIRGFKR